MTTRATSLRRPSAFFALSTLFVIAACLMVLRSAAFARQPEVLAWGVTFDLTITIPLLYWFFVVRPGHAGTITLVPLFVVCTLLATALIPRAYQQFARHLRIAAIPLEVFVGVLVVRRIRRGEGRAASFVRAEAAMFHYAFAGWWKKPEEVDGRAITFHERSGWGSIVACVLVLIACEGLAMHLFLASWSTTAARIWTALDVWGAIWFLGDYHALRLRRSWLGADALHIRHGMRWSAEVALSNIAAIEDVRSESEWKQRGVLKLAMIDEPRYLVRLHEPVGATGLAGIRRTIHAIAMRPDDDSLVSALSSACGLTAAAEAAAAAPRARS